MWNYNKKSVTRLLVKVVLFSAVIFIAYYLLFIRSDLILPKALSDAEKFVAKQHLALVENRVAIKAFVDLEVDGSGFANQKSELVQKIKGSNQSALDVLGQDYKGRKINLEADKELINFFNTELPKKLKQLSAEGTTVLQKLQQTIENLFGIHGN